MQTINGEIKREITFNFTGSSSPEIPIIIALLNRLQFSDEVTDGITPEQIAIDIAELITKDGVVQTYYNAAISSAASQIEVREKALRFIRKFNELNPWFYKTSFVLLASILDELNLTDELLAELTKYQTSIGEDKTYYSLMLKFKLEEGYQINKTEIDTLLDKIKALE